MLHARRLVWSLVGVVFSVAVATGCGSSTSWVPGASTNVDAGTNADDRDSAAPNQGDADPSSAGDADFTVTTADPTIVLECAQPITGDGIRVTMPVTIENKGTTTLPSIVFTRGRILNGVPGSGAIVEFTPRVEMAPLAPGGRTTVSATFVPGTLVPQQRCGDSNTSTGQSPLGCQGIYTVELYYEHGGEERKVFDVAKSTCDPP